MNGKDCLLLAAKVRAVKLELSKCDGRRLCCISVLFQAACNDVFLAALTGGVDDPKADWCTKARGCHEALCSKDAS